MKRSIELNDKMNLLKLKTLCHNLFMERYISDQCIMIEDFSGEYDVYYVIVGRMIGNGLISAKSKKTFNNINNAYNYYLKTVKPYIMRGESV